MVPGQVWTSSDDCSRYARVRPLQPLPLSYTERILEMTDAVHPQVARIPAGEFTMGSESGEDDERPAHRVYLDEFCIGVYPVTHDQYGAFIRDTNHRLPAIRQLPRIVAPDQEQVFRELSTPYVWRAGAPPRDRGNH